MVANESIDPALFARERESWRHADAVICSSSFTRRSLVEAGCNASICHVVPYGVLPAPANMSHADSRLVLSRTVCRIRWPAQGTASSLDGVARAKLSDDSR